MKSNEIENGMKNEPQIDIQTWTPKPPGQQAHNRLLGTMLCNVGASLCGSTRAELTANMAAQAAGQLKPTTASQLG